MESLVYGISLVKMFFESACSWLVLLESRILQTDDASDLPIISSGDRLDSSFFGSKNADFTTTEASIILSSLSEKLSSSTSIALGFESLSVFGALFSLPNVC
jgi:hypothetical protein